MLFLEKNIARIFALIKKIRGRASKNPETFKTPETFDFKDLLKKQKQNAEAINSIHEAISKADKIVIIYSKDLPDELYFERKILDIIEKKLKDGVKIVFLSNEENKASTLIRWYLYAKNGIKINYLSKNEELLYIDNVGELAVDFIMADKQYTRVEFCRKEHTSKFYDTKNKDKSEEAQRWIDMTYDILTNNIINKLEKEGRLEQANKLKEFINLKF